jgi:beta-1,4-mannosyltransferase
MTALRVLQSFPEPRPTTNPYVVMLRRALDELPDVEVLTFSWRRALAAPYDVVHLHWPEILVAGRGPKAMARRALFLLLMFRLSLRRTPVVRTAHNLRPWEDLPRPVQTLLRLAERRTTLVIRLNDETPLPDGMPAVTVLHGHYRDWFAQYPRADRRPWHAAFVGLLRPYKNVDGLISAFAGTAGNAPQARLVVAGNPQDPELAATVRAAAEGDARVSLRLAHLDDAELVEVITRAELVVLPYREMHNSGAALLALSLDRPVLVPANDVNARLAEEVGGDWVLRYDGELSGNRLLEALDRVRTLPPAARPDLSRREWHRAGLDHLAAYRTAVELRRGALRAARPDPVGA